MNLFQLAAKLLKLPKVHLATADEELEAICRFRYEVYVNEYNRRHFSEITDDACRKITDERDKLDNVLNFYIGTPDNIIATMRLNIWRAGQIPNDVIENYQLSKLPDISNTDVLEYDRYLVRSDIRGGRLVFAFIAEFMEKMYTDTNCEIFCLYAPLGVIKAYAKYGWRLLSDHVIEGNDGLVASMVALPYDTQYLKTNIGKPLYFAYKQLAIKGKPKHRPDFFSNALSDAGSKVIIDRDSVERVFNEVVEKK